MRTPPNLPNASMVLMGMVPCFLPSAWPCLTLRQRGVLKRRIKSQSVESMIFASGVGTGDNPLATNTGIYGPLGAFQGLSSRFPL
jgi:hypothetical protein